MLLVTVAGRPDVGVGSPVAVQDLVAIPWSQGDRSGVAYRAGTIQSLGTSIAGVTGTAPAQRSAAAPTKQAA